MSTSVDGWNLNVIERLFRVVGKYLNYWMEIDGIKMKKSALIRGIEGGC